MKTIIAIIGLTSFAGIFLGTAIGLLFFSLEFAITVFVASLLSFMFAFISQISIEKV